jgi:hypothetical protein
MMAIAFYTLQSDGQATKSVSGNISSEWWTSAPQTNIGSFYQVRATITDNRVTTGTINGIFDTWVTISQNLTWSVDSVTTFEGIVVTFQLRKLLETAILDTATITIGRLLIPVQQQFVWLMGEGDLNRYRYFSASRAVLSSAISLMPGDTISFTWISSANTGNGDYILSSSLAAPNQSFIRSNGTSIFEIQGFTVTVDGVPKINGEAIPSSTVSIERFAFVCTATVATDIQFFNSDNVVTPNSRGQNPIYNLVINNGTVFSFPMQTFGATFDADTGGSGITIQFTDTFNSIRWRNQPFLDSTGISNISLAPSDTFVGPTKINTQQPSFLVDASGFSLNYGTDSEQFNQRFISIAYQNGFTIEGAVKIDVISSGGGASTNGRGGSFIEALSGTERLWTLRFDNYANSAVEDVVPCFTLLNSNEAYRNPSDYNAGNYTLDLRGATPLVLGNIYHIMATIRPSNNTAEIWINGTSVAAGNIPPSWYGTLGVDSVLDGSRDTLVNVGAAYINLARRRCSTTIQNVQIHLQEADDALAAQQASLVNFTT